MTTRPSSQPPRDQMELAKRVAKLTRSVHTLERTNSISRGSIVNGGAITAYQPNPDNPADVGNPGLIVGTQYDGSYTATPVAGPNPPQPKAPTVTAELHAARVNWSGTYLDSSSGAEDIAIVAPMDFSRVEIHAVPSALHVPLTSDTIVGTFETPRGGDTLVPITGEDPVWIKLVVRSVPGKRSAASPGVEVTPLQGAPGELSPEDLARIEAAEAAAEAASDAADQALAAAGDAQATADGKVATHFVNDPPSGMVPGDVGDLWFDTNDNNKMYRWDGDSWEPSDDTRISQALTDAYNARIVAIEAPWLGSNSTFENWPSTYPTGWGVGDGVPVKETALIRTGSKAVRFNPAAAGTAASIVESTALDPMPVGIEYVAVEVDFLLVSGGLGGSGIALDWDGLTPARVTLSLSSQVPSPALNKWYRVSTILRRPTGTTGTHTGYTARLLGNSSIIGSMAAKNIIFDRLAFRAATSAEVQSYNAATASSVTSLANIVSTKITTFRQPGIPVATAAGDLWVDTDDQNRLYRAAAAGADQITAGEWEDTRDGLVLTAVNAAEAAQQTADGKNSVTYSTAAPGTSPNALDDVWFQRDPTTNRIIGMWQGLGGTSWASRQINSEVIAEVDAGVITVGYLSGDRVDVDFLNGKLMVGGVIKTAELGARIEITSAGLSQYDDNGVLIMRLTGAANEFHGSVKADDILVRDGLELFGKNNAFKTGAEVVLATGQGGSGQAPTVESFYETSPLAIAGYLEIAQGMYTDGNESTNYSGTAFYGFSNLRRGAVKWGFPGVTRSDGSLASSFSLWGYTRVRHSAERAVVIGYVTPPGHDPSSFSTPLEVRAYNDLSMTSSVAPTLVSSFQYAPSFSFFRTVALGKLWGVSGWESQFALAELINDGNGTATINLSVLNLPNDGPMSLSISRPNNPFPLVDNAETVIGVAYGTLAGMKLVPPGDAQANALVWVVMTTHQNIVWLHDTIGPTGRYTPLEWPVAISGAGIGMTLGAINNSATGFTRFATAKRGGNTDAASTQILTRYSNTSWAGTEPPIWVQFAWKGHSSQNSPEYLTTPSPLSIQHQRVKRARVRVTVPDLPTPVNGLGAARDTAKDVYSYRLYVGQKATAPTRTEMWRAAETPAGEPATTRTLVLPETLLLSGTNPLLATQGFTALTPARIVSSAGDGGGPYLIIDGDGNGKFRTVNGQTMADTGWITVPVPGQPNGLLNNWVYFNSIRTPQYRLRNGWVFMRGLVKNGNINSNIFTLPVGFRPAVREMYDMAFPCVCNAAAGAVAIDGAQGVVVHMFGSTAWIDLAGVRFLAEA